MSPSLAAPRHLIRLQVVMLERKESSAVPAAAPAHHQWQKVCSLCAHFAVTVYVMEWLYFSHS